MKVQPIEALPQPLPPAAAAAATATKSRFKRLFEKQFLKSSTAASGGGDAEPSSLCLDKMVVNFIEEADSKPPSRHGGGYNCNCFHRSSICDSDSDEDPAAAGDADEESAAATIKSLVQCASLAERNLLADVTVIIDKHKSAAGGSIPKKADLRRHVAAALRAANLDASLCKSKWDKSPAFPAAGEYEYIDVVVAGERILVEVDFRAEFEMARPTKKYRAVLQTLPVVFVGREERLRLLVAAAADAGRVSMKKKGLSFPPWRRREYLLAKWLSPAYERQPPSSPAAVEKREVGGAEAEEREWELPPVRPKLASPSSAPVTGLAAALRESN